MKVLISNNNRVAFFICLLQLVLWFLAVILGFLLRKKEFRNISKIVTVLIWLLLFILGLEVGGNPQIISGQTSRGIEALIITVAAVLGSPVTALLLWKHINKKSSYQYISQPGLSGR